MEVVLSTLTEKIISKIRHIYVIKVGPAVRAIKTPTFPKNLDGKVLVHIGCGEVDDPRFINVDALALPHIHHVCNKLDLHQFSKNSIDLIYACHVLEHIPHRKLELVLRHWCEHLKDGGVLRISIPDFDRIIEIYQDQGKRIKSIQNPLMGGQEYETNFHHVAINYEYLKDILLKNGFKSVGSWDPNTAKYHSFDDWAG